MTGVYKGEGLKAKYVTFDYQDHKDLNISLYNTICDNLSDQPVEGGGIITPYWNLHTWGLEDLDTICKWIQSESFNAAYIFSQGGEDDRGNCGFSPNSFEIAECWGIHYTQNTNVVMHNHFPYALSFLYCIRSPKDSSPIIIEGEHIESVEGRLVFFLPHQYHGTLPTNTTGRCMIAGNLGYNWR